MFSKMDCPCCRSSGMAEIYQAFAKQSAIALIIIFSQSLQIAQSFRFLFPHRMR